MAKNIIMLVLFAGFIVFTVFCSKQCEGGSTGNIDDTQTAITKLRSDYIELEKNYQRLELDYRKLGQENSELQSDRDGLAKSIRELQEIINASIAGSSDIADTIRRLEEICGRITN